ncbi:restriction endonuclease subunit S [Caldibacillus thermoamylovorans]|uniref:restriction endonuclease subunit S n=1 Tax=Caldibacillus thermoamylovorans TaxID=35841 RepID=UPI00203CDA0F|nr:restriction endonuclease subunit S [Caldibacillus thermoamylovorans]MCM3799410.1 restriction endonuclease subunit S [Caldibacillus thermoamylovorans]
MSINYKRLGDIATYINGYAFKPKDWGTKGLPIIRIQNLTGSSKEINFYDGDIDEKYIVRKGDILIAWSASLGVHEWNGEKALLNQHIFKVVFDKEKINKNFFKFMVQKLLERTQKYLHGSTMKHITKKYFDNLLIPFPPLEIQEKIAGTLLLAESLVNKRKAQIESLDQLTQSVFLEMFGDIRINSKKFKQVKLNEVITKITTGKSLAGEGISEYKVLKTSAVSYKFFKQNEVKYLPQDYVPPVSHIVNKGDVLVSRMNTSELVGAAAYVFNEIKNVALPDRIWKLHYSRKINPIFLWYFINQSYFRDKVTDIATGTSGSMKNISQKKYLNLSILLPDISLQNKFAEFVYKIQIEKDKMDKGLIELNNIFNSLMQRTFNGKLFPE